MQDRPLYVFTAAQIVAVVVVLWYVFSRPSPWDWQRSAGVALMIVGYAGIATARYYLGKSFALRPQAHQLVTHGVYSKIRNPIYVFGLIAIAGLVLVLHRPVLWLLVVAIRSCRHCAHTAKPRCSKPHLAMPTASTAARPGSETWF